MKRLTILCGHYGSGKTNIAVNMAVKMAQTEPRVTLADLDIVNPYFRSKDSLDLLKAHNIRFICSDYANSNVDIPALPADLYAITDDHGHKVILDIGGDDRGAYVLGRLTPKVLEENDFDMLMVVNRYRPLTPDAPSTIEVMREIEIACGLPFTGIINNSNLGAETTRDVILDSVPYAREVCALSGLPLFGTAAEASLCKDLPIENLIPLRLQKRL